MVVFTLTDVLWDGEDELDGWPDVPGDCFNDSITFGELVEWGSDEEVSE